MVLESKANLFDGPTSSATKVLRLLEVVASAPSARLRDLEEITGLPKPSLIRLLNTLVDQGYVRRQQRGEYAPALKLWQLGCSAVNYDNVRESILPTLRDIVENTSETAHYAVYEHGRSIYVEKVDGLQPIRSYTQTGSSSPAYATATGKALLAWQSEEEIRKVMHDAERHTESTLTSLPGFLHAVDEIKTNGYAVNRGEWRSGVWGVASPIFDHRGTVAAAIGVSGPQTRIADNVDFLASITTAAAKHLSSLNGWAP